MAHDVVKMVSDVNAVIEMTRQFAKIIHAAIKMADEATKMAVSMVAKQ